MTESEPNGTGAPVQPSPPSWMNAALRRETTSSRATTAGVVALLVTLLCLYALLESTLRAVGQPAWLIDPQSAAESLTRLPNGTSPLVLGLVGVLAALLGLVLLLKAVLPGNRGRRVLPVYGVGVVADDEVIASALARRARSAANVRAEQVSVVMTRREAVVNVRPTSGIPVSAEDVLEAVEDELRGLSPQPYPVARIRVSGAGVVGA